MDNKNKTLIAGALIGAVTGVFAAMLLQRRVESEERETAITTGEGLKLGRLDSCFNTLSIKTSELSNYPKFFHLLYIRSLQMSTENKGGELSTPPLFSVFFPIFVGSKALF